ncbi:MAG: magnesium chelatase, partial [Anaerolineae bacterium]|nr:magnesium chelatase [Anaerolineae bacterium]
AAEQELSRRIAEARERLPLVVHTPRDLRYIAELTAAMGVDGHRGDIVILKSARASAALEGRLRISEADILQAAELALPHRLKRQPLQEGEVEPQRLEKKLQEVRARVEAADPDAGAFAGKKKT